MCVGLRGDAPGLREYHSFWASSSLPPRATIRKPPGSQAQLFLMMTWLGLWCWGVVVEVWVVQGRAHT